jgi:hypothetical protein
VRDLELGVERIDGSPADPIAIGAGRRDDVRRHDRVLAVHGPGVEIVDRFDAVDERKALANPAHVEAGRRKLEEDPPRVAQDADASRGDERGDEHADEWVGDEHAAEEEDPRHDGADRSERVGEHVHERSAHVQVVAIGAVERPGTPQVDHEPERAHDEHGETVDRRRRVEASERLVHDEHGDRDEREGVHEGAERFRPLEAKRHAGARGSAAELVRRQREHERADVAGHVRGIGEKCQRAGPEPDRGLGDEEQGVQRERERQRAAGVRTDRVGMRMRVGVIVMVGHTLEILFK